MWNLRGGNSAHLPRQPVLLQFISYIIVLPFFMIFIFCLFGRIWSFLRYDGCTILTLHLLEKQRLASLLVLFVDHYFLVEQLRLDFSFSCCQAAAVVVMFIIQNREPLPTNFHHFRIWIGCSLLTFGQGMFSQVLLCMLVLQPFAVTFQRNYVCSKK